MSMEFLSESEKFELQYALDAAAVDVGQIGLRAKQHRLADFHATASLRKVRALLYEARVLRRAGENMCALAGTTEWEGCNHPWTFDGWIAQAKAEIDAEVQA